jgi:hypothetical protein
MGAIGAAVLASESVQGTTNFRGFKTAKSKFESTSFECNGCANCCEVVTILQNKSLIVGRFGDKCGKWSEAGLKEKQDSI